MYTLCKRFKRVLSEERHFSSVSRMAFFFLPSLENLQMLEKAFHSFRALSSEYNMSSLQILVLSSNLIVYKLIISGLVHPLLCMKP